MTVDLLELCRRIAAQAAPGEQIEAYAAKTEETDIEVFDAHIESLSIAGTEGVGIRVVKDHRLGFAWAGSLDEELVRDALSDARDNARFAEPNEWNGLATPADCAAGPYVEMDLWRDSLERITTAEKVELVLGLDAALRAADPRIRAVESASYGDGAVRTAVANSNGVETSLRRTVCSASAVALAGDEAETQSGYGFAIGREFDDIDVAEIVAMASERTLRLLGAGPVKSMRIPVIFDPLVTASLLGVLSSVFSAEAMLKGRSLFGERVGEDVAAATVSLSCDPMNPLAMGAAPHDAEGVPCRTNRLITNGVLHGFLHNTSTARRGATSTTGSAVRGGFKTTPGVGVRNFSFAPGTRSQSEIIAGTDLAFYVQSVSGIHSGTNPISGDFSVGASGLVVRGGEFAEAVREVTIASTLGRMLQEVAEVGSDLTYLGGSTTGATLAISEMTLSGT